MMNFMRTAAGSNSRRVVAMAGAAALGCGATIAATHHPALAEKKTILGMLEQIDFRLGKLERVLGYGKPRIGLLTPQAYMKNALDELAEEYDIVPITPATGDWSQETIDYWVKYCKDNDVPCVVGFAQKDSWHHPLINAGLGNITVSALSYLIAMNKYMQRTIEPGAFWFTSIDPDKQTNQEIIDSIPKDEWPFMLKNTSLSLGAGVFFCPGPERADQILNLYRKDKALQSKIKRTNDAITERMTSQETQICGEVPPFLGEHCVDMNKGWTEYCYEGLVTEEGELVHYGMTEEVYMQDHSGMAYITPPVRYPSSDVAQLDKYITKCETPELLQRPYCLANSPPPPPRPMNITG
eukprot:SAG31_NODE_328_length_17643_cov_46.707649_8_plen_353_part_00